MAAHACFAADHDSRIRIAWWRTGPSCPQGLAWGQVISVDVLPNGNMVVFQRAEPPLLIFDPSGTLVKSFGDGMFVQPHGLTVDREGFIWASDAGARNGKGQQVFKFTQDGKVVMTLGTAGVAGESATTFNGPTDIAIAPNGDIFVSDGHVNNRVVKFSKDGKFIKAWGKKGSGPGEFNVPHTLAFDSRGRLFVGDRSNSRIQIFDQDGKYLEEWKQFSRPSGIFIKGDTILVADSDSNTATNPGWKRGIRIGSVKTGKVTALIPDTRRGPRQQRALVSGRARDLGDQRTGRRRDGCAGERLRGRSRTAIAEEVRQEVALSPDLFAVLRVLGILRGTAGNSNGDSGKFRYSVDSAVGGPQSDPVGASTAVGQLRVLRVTISAGSRSNLTGGLELWRVLRSVLIPVVIATRSREASIAAPIAKARPRPPTLSVTAAIPSAATTNDVQAKLGLSNRASALAS